MQMTSAYANKTIKQLEEEKEYWTNKESESYLYTAAVDEEPVIPDYDYAEVAGKIEEIDQKVCRIKHAINLSNANATINVDGEMMSVDVILVRMSQLNKRKAILDGMRKQLPKTRIDSGAFGARKASPEYRYINYDLNLIKSEYEIVSKKILAMQMALDKHNQTAEFELEI